MKVVIFPKNGFESPLTLIGERESIERSVISFFWGKNVTEWLVCMEGRMCQSPLPNLNEWADAFFADTK